MTLSLKNIPSSHIQLWFQALMKSVSFGTEDDSMAKLLETYQFLIKTVLMKNESKLPRALQILDEALDKYPDIAEFHSMRATVLTSMDRTKEALDALSIASNAAVILPSVHYSYGLVYSKHGDLKKAEEYFSNAVRLDRGNNDALLELGMLYFKTGGSARKSEGENM